MFNSHMAVAVLANACRFGKCSSLLGAVEFYRPTYLFILRILRQVYVFKSGFQPLPYEAR